MCLTQVVIAFQGFEENASDTWNYTPPTQNPNTPQVIVGAGNYGAGYANTGNGSMRFGGGSTTCATGSGNCVAGTTNGGSCNNNPNGNIVTFAPVDILCYNSVAISVAYRTHVFCSSQGEGLDAPDRLYFEVSLDGGAFMTVSTINGTNNCVWTYATSPVTCAGPAVVNPFVYNVPAGTNTVAFRVRLQMDRSDEVMYIDDVTISGFPVSVTTMPIYHD